MEQEFDAEAFLRKLEQGSFDGHLQEALGKLTRAQLEEVDALITKRKRAKEAD